MNLRDLRKRAGMKPSDLASKMAVDTTTITRWETGMRKPDINSLVKLSQILDCSIDDLLNPILPPAEAAEGRGRKKEAFVKKPRSGLKRSKALRKSSTRAA